MSVFLTLVCSYVLLYVICIIVDLWWFLAVFCCRNKLIDWLTENALCHVFINGVKACQTNKTAEVLFNRKNAFALPHLHLISKWGFGHKRNYVAFWLNIILKYIYLSVMLETTFLSLFLFFFSDDTYQLIVKFRAITLNKASLSVVTWGWKIHAMHASTNWIINI